MASLSPGGAAAPWLLLQLVDGAFPSGGFAHSGGLEAAVHLRHELDLERFVEEALWHASSTTTPFVRSACEDGEQLLALDALFDATCTSHVANRASRAQGRALAAAACRVFDERADVRAIGDHARSGSAHHPVVFGTLFGALGMSPRDTQMAWLHGILRGLLSAAVRLGAVGPLEAQQIQAGRAAVLDAILAKCMHVDVSDACQTSPLVDLYGALHDRLDGRLFQS